MKKYMLIVSFVFLFVLPGYCADITADSSIKDVTVYPDSALLTRVATLDLTPGQHKVVFANIIPEVDENSLRVSAVGDVKVTLFGAKLKREFLQEEASVKVKQLTDDIQKAEDELAGLQNIKNALSDEKNFLDSIRLFSNQQIPEDLITKVPSAGDLEGLLIFLDSKLRDNYSKTQEADIKMRDLSEIIEAMRKELQDVSMYNSKVARSIEVEMEAAGSGKVDLSISYLVWSANWRPIYDARANYSKNEVELVSYGIVKQTTGEDWTDVNASLSTARPATGGLAPEPYPWLLRPYQPPQQLRSKSRDAKVCFELAEAAAPAKEALCDYATGNGIGGPEQVEAEEAYANAQERGISVVYTLPKKATIKSDGSENKLPIASQTLSAKFEYLIYPRASSSAFLLAKAINNKDLQLLSGRVNVFFEGDFVGTSHIKNIAPGEELELSLGPDEGLKVTRELIEKKVDETLMAGIPATTRRTIFAYKVKAENYKPQSVKVNIFESTPVSEDDRIKVKISSVSIEPSKKDWKDKKGVWLWTLELATKEKKELTYSFVIECPREMQIEGLW